MWAVIPAAGRGTRLAGVAQGLPKPLLEVGGRPLVLGVLDRVAPAVDRICVVVPPDDPRVEATVRSATGREIDFATQHRRFGVGHAVLQAASMVSGPTLVVMGDGFYSGSLEPFVAAWKESGMDGAVLVERPTGPASAVMGRVHAVGGRVRTVAKTTPDSRFEWRVAGAFILPASVFRVLDRLGVSEAAELELETAITELLEQGGSFAAIPFEGWRANVNRPEDVALVQSRLAAMAAEGPAR